MRVGCQMPLEIGSLSECRKEIDREGCHLLTCKFGGGPVWQHDAVVQVGLSVLDLEFHHKKEPRLRYTATESHPDIVVFDSDQGSNIDLDVAMAHPWSSEALPRSAAEDGFAATRREERKRTKYDQLMLPGGMSPLFTPLVFEHFGRWGVAAESYLDTLASRCKTRMSQNSPADFRSFWRKRFSIIIQKTNAKLIPKKLRRLTEDANEEDVLFEREMQSDLH